MDHNSITHYTFIPWAGRDDNTNKSSIYVIKTIKISPINWMLFMNQVKTLRIVIFRLINIIVCRQKAWLFRVLLILVWIQRNSKSFLTLFYLCIDVTSDVTLFQVFLKSVNNFFTNFQRTAAFCIFQPCKNKTRVENNRTYSTIKRIEKYFSLLLLINSSAIDINTWRVNY